MKRTSVATLTWISKEIDKINEDSVWIGEELMAATDPEIVKILDRRLSELENKMSYLQSKLQVEKRAAMSE